MEIAILTSGQSGMQSLFYVKWNDTWLALFLILTFIIFFWILRMLIHIPFIKVSFPLLIYAKWLFKAIRNFPTSGYAPIHLLFAALIPHHDQ